ncbi:MAG: TonB-dependent receptor [Ignavibacteria bacterium]
MRLRRTACTWMMLLLALPEARSHQGGTIVGHVVDRETQSSVPGANVVLDGTELGAAADASGRFLIERVPPGAYALTVTAVGYLKHIQPITLDSRDTLRFTIALAPDVLKFEEVTSTGERTFSTASSEFMRALDFELRPKQSAQEMLRMVPGLVIAQHAGGGKAEQIFLRGFDADHGTDINLSVDGVPVNMVSHGHGQGYADLHFVISEVIEGMEVYKGPYFAAFGDLATAGSVRLKTRESIEHNLLSFEGGKFGTYRTLGMVRLPTQSQTTNAYVAAEYYHTDGYFDTRIDLNRYNVFGKLVAATSESGTLSLWASGFGSQWNATGQIPQRAVETGLIGRFGSIDPSEGGRTARFNVHLGHLLTLDERSTLNAQAYASRYQFRLYSNFTFFAVDSINGDGIEQQDDRFLFGGQAEYTRQHSLGALSAIGTIGASVRADVIDVQLFHHRQRQRLGTKADALIRQKTFALFAQEELRLSRTIRTQLGVRADFFSFDVEDPLGAVSNHEPITGVVRKAVVTPKLNTVFTLDQSLEVFVNVGGGFHSNDARAVVAGKAERTLPRAWGAELGIRFTPAPRTSFAVAAWGLDLQNELVYVGDEGTTEINGATRRIGLDAEVRAQLSSWLFADVDVTLARGRFRDLPAGEDYIPLAPTLTINAGLTARHENGLEGSVRVRHISSRPANENNTVTALGYTVFDASVAYRFAAYRVQLTAENLLNVQWNEAQFDTESRLRGETAPISELHFTPGTPFNLKLKAEVGF